MSVVEARSSAVSAEWLLERIQGRGANDLAEGLSALISSGELAAGAQLPTIRGFASVAGVSVGTVLSAWNQLRETGAIDTRRRGGTIVNGRKAPAHRAPAEVDWSAVDFQLGAPDIALQPDLSGALLESLTAKNLNVFGREYMTDRLQAAVGPAWPFEAEAWTTAGGGTEALLLATAAVAEPGSLIAIDEPASPGFLETLRDLQLTPVPVEMDAHGPVPESLARALAAGARAFVFQPGGPFATGYTVTPERVAELAGVLAADEHAAVTVVEDDSIGPLAAQEPPTLGRLLPGRVLRVRSYCKAYGIDVRTSVIGGPRRLVARTIELRSHGVGSNSRILQNTLASLIGSAEVAECVAVAREHYARRRETLRVALEARGLVVHAAPDGIVLWVEVPDETDALVGLAAQGVLAGGASKSFVVSPIQPMIRLSPLQLDEDQPEIFDRLADLVQRATRNGRREFFD